MVPAYRKREILRLYSVFEEPGDIHARKKEFVRLLKTYYKWAGARELNEMYVTAYEHEVERELQRSAQQTIKGRVEDISKVFCAIDANKSGSISIAEFAKFAQPFLKTRTMEVFADADTNGDGVLSLDEFVCYVGKNGQLLAHFNDILASALKRRRTDFVNRVSILFKEHPTSPSDMSWRPSLSMLNS